MNSEVDIIQPVEECKCNGPEPGERTFFCHYHQCTKTQHLRELCKNRETYRVAWNQNRGPGQNFSRGEPARQSEPRPEKEVEDIVKVLCPACPNYHADTQTCHGFTGRCARKNGLRVARMALRRHCPIYKW